MPRKNVFVIRYVNGKYLIEAPIGTLQYETGRPISVMRVAPDGRIAFIEQVSGKNMLSVITNRKLDPIAAGWGHGVTGLVWHPTANEIWQQGFCSSAAVRCTFSPTP